jgi:formylglycine-generating enzyme required for sulfatase activity
MREMIELRGVPFRMNSDRFFPEERTVSEVSVGPLWIDGHPATVAEFRRFVQNTGHVTCVDTSTHIGFRSVVR